MLKQTQEWETLASERCVAAQNRIQPGFQLEQIEAYTLYLAFIALRRDGHKDFLWGNISVAMLIEGNHILVLLQP